MTLQPFASWAVIFACSTAAIAGQQSSQTDAPRNVPSVTTSGSTTQPSPVPQPPPPPVPQIGRPDPAATAATPPNTQTLCAGTPAVATGQPSSSTSFPGVSASELPRAGVSAEKFVRPGVSAAELATLQPGAKRTPCAAPRDVILYPETGTPARRVPPPGENEP
jgi:hypothetical protein